MNQDQLARARRIAYLVTGFIRNDLAVDERLELDEWIAESSENMKLFSSLTDRQKISESKQWFDSLDQEAAVRRLNEAMSKRPFSLARIHWAWLAAACVILIAGVWLVRYAGGDSGRRNQVVAEEKRGSLILPGSRKAILVNEKGKEIDLSDARNSILVVNDKNQATNMHSVLSYSAEGGIPVMHTLRTPRGAEYRVVLSDGTKVWLNAESSLRYPTRFSGAAREVELTGEGYFEVARNAAQRFVVKTEETAVKVIGTHFNVNAYTKGHENVSLLEGVVEVNVHRQSRRMVSGERARVSEAGLRVEKDGHIAASIAWTRGRFSFNGTPLQEVMAQVGRWYDVDVEYLSDEKHEFTGEIFRSSSIQEVLRMLRLSTGDHFDIDGKMITVRP